MSSRLHVHARGHRINPFRPISEELASQLLRQLKNPSSRTGSEDVLYRMSYRQCFTVQSIRKECGETGVKCGLIGNWQQCFDPDSDVGVKCGETYVHMTDVYIDFFRWMRAKQELLHIKSPSHITARLLICEHYTHDASN